MEMLCRELGTIEIKGLNWGGENLPPRPDGMNVGTVMWAPATAHEAALRKVL